MAAVASPYLVRAMTVADIPQVTEIERESFPTMWPQTAYKRELQQNGMARYLVVGDATSALRPPAEEGAPAAAVGGGGGGGLGRIWPLRGVRRILRAESAAETPAPLPAELLVGFVGLWFMLEECHVVTVAVREARRRRGIGELLVISAIEMALKKEQEVLTLECRVSNTGAQALYEKYGFQTAGVRKRYYTDNNEDALVMTTPKIQTPEYQALFARLRAAHHDRWGAARIDHPEL